MNLEWSRSIQFPLPLRSPENVARLPAPVTCLSIVIHRSVDRHEEFFDPFFHRSLDPQVSPSSRFGGGRAPASFLDPSFLFPGNFDRRLSTIAPVMAARHEYIYIYIYRGEIGTRCDSPGEQGRGQRGAWGLDILYPSAVFRERISESKVCRRSIRQRRGAASCVHAHDTMHSKRPSLLIRAPLYPNTALERLWSGGIRADSRVIHG